MKEIKLVVKFFTFLIFISVPISFFYYKNTVANGYKISFSGIYERKIFRRTDFYVFKIGKDSVLIYPGYRLSDDFEKEVEIGDSIMKIKNKNECYIFKKDGTAEFVEFENK